MSKQTINVSLSVFFAFIVVFGAGCGPCRRSADIAPILTPQQFTVQTLGYSNENRPIDLFTAGNGPDTIFIFSAIHGNEQAGMTLAFELMERLRERSELLKGRQCIIIPIANPDGVVRNTRGNANRIDLNRNFPAANRENSEVFGFIALSEPESKLLHDLIHRTRPSRIVSLHQPLKCIDYDGPAKDLAAHMGAYCALPVKKLGARPGSFGAYAGETMGIPIITLELERADDMLTADQLWQRYGMAMIAAITYPNAPY